MSHIWRKGDYFVFESVKGPAFGAATAVRPNVKVFFTLFSSEADEGVAMETPTEDTKDWIAIDEETFEAARELGFAGAGVDALLKKEAMRLTRS